MSAESPLRSNSQTSTNGSPSTISPQQVTDPTILDSVAGFINEVVPTAYNNPPEVDDKIQWAHFEQLESEESSLGFNYDGDNVIPPALILILGYSTGIQIWAIPATGEATEILSWRHSILRVLKLIPTPFNNGSKENIDLFASARPLIALCDSTANYSTLAFRSVKSGGCDPVKQIQFKSSILNVLANRHSVVVSFSEKIAVFDAFTLENRVSITTCYLSPGIQANPIALGSKWLAYAEKKLVVGNRSGGGNEGEGVQSYTASVLHAAKSLGRGLRELTETVAGSLTGNPNFKPGSSTSSPQAGGAADVPQKGIVTIIDIENKNLNSKENIPQDAVIAHFAAHSEAIVCLSFDPSGMLLLTSDKRGHDFHVFRIQPHPAGPALAAVHHLYILHRGDTSAKVQDMCFSPDSRWITVSTLRGTTHVFPVTPYGGNISVRTHATAHVVNKMSRYQRSAGLTSEGRSSSPVSLAEAPVSLFPYRNPRFPPYPQPTVVNALAQIRQPLYVQSTVTAQQRAHPARQRLSSSSEENISLRVVACFAAPRAWIDAGNTNRENSCKQQIKPVESLFVMSCYGMLIQYDLEPHPSACISKERVCNDSSIDLKVCAKAQWILHRQSNAADIPLPMSQENLNYIAQSVPLYKKTKPDHSDDQWLSQVEIVTHLGPHRRLWMGPQFTFKTYTITNGSVLETRPVDVRRSKPVNMPVSKANAILIESGSASSCEQLFLDTYHKACDEVGSVGESRLKEDLADAMLESPGIRDSGGHCVLVSMKPSATVAKVVNPLGTVVTVQSEDDSEAEIVEDAVIHENCDEALFRPVVAAKAVFYAEATPKSRHPDNILTKSLEANTEVAVRIINNKDNKAKEAHSKSSKHIIRSREPSPKIRRDVGKNKAVITKSYKAELNLETQNKPEVRQKARDRVARKEERKHDPLPAKPPSRPPVEKIDETDFETFDDSHMDVRIEEAFDKGPDSLLYESTLKFEDAEDCEIEKLPLAAVKFDAKADSELNCSSEEERIAAKKVRKPRAKLGVKIPKDKENTVEAEINLNPIKKSWNLVAASKPPEKIINLDLPEIESVDYTFKLPSKEVMVDSVEKLDEREASLLKTFNSLKIDKSSDEDKGDVESSPTDNTESSDDSSKIPPVANIINIDDEDDLVPVQTQSASKTSKRKSKKKRK